MTAKVDVYKVVLRFPRLFPDPVVFEDQNHLANRYLLANGLSGERGRLIFQTTEEVVPLDDRGGPATTGGTAKYQFEGRTILAEYMANASVQLGYVDFGTLLAVEDHERLWSKEKIGELRFELKSFKHQRQTLNIPEISELYKILKERATPSTLSTIELDTVPGDLFTATLGYVERTLRTAAEADGLELEIYAARNLRSSEKAALERRLTRQSGKSTVFVILSRPPLTKLQTPVSGS